MGAAGARVGARQRGATSTSPALDRTRTVAAAPGSCATVRSSSPALVSASTAYGPPGSSTRTSPALDSAATRSGGRAWSSSTLPAELVASTAEAVSSSPVTPPALEARRIRSPPTRRAVTSPAELCRSAPAVRPAASTSPPSASTTTAASRGTRTS
ncbi:MAG: hypothetical protein AVDCRST_MAG13-2190 [uncultured Solirubrobacteraceae bacterium]|uniref:Uncharacterized protein n=1 Tax=uncultured Solirubrobacteraceae bacterium TaxID=1162706 RepID=A0A6J4SJ82_9ACTN|nr:MAG: hypothetical protein AVDCRST_MAG13-2190 [uncultured Solirubrobacteraceae bacterium]